MIGYVKIKKPNFNVLCCNNFCIKDIMKNAISNIITGNMKHVAKHCPFDIPLTFYKSAKNKEILESLISQKFSSATNSPIRNVTYSAVCIATP